MMQKPYGRKARPHGGRSTAAQYSQAPSYYAPPPQLADYPAQAAPVYSAPYPPPTAAYFAPAAQTPYYGFPPADKRTVEEMVRRQIEYYFSDENLIKDIFLRSKMDKDGFVLLNEIASFQRVVSLTQDMDTILNALKDSESVELCDGIKVRPKREPHRWPLTLQPQQTPQTQQQISPTEQIEKPQDLQLQQPLVQLPLQQQQTDQLLQLQQQRHIDQPLSQLPPPQQKQQQQQLMQQQQQSQPQHQHQHQQQQQHLHMPHQHQQLQHQSIQHPHQHKHQQHHQPQQQQLDQQPKQLDRQTQRQNQTHTHPGQALSDASSPDKSNNSDISSVANNVDNTNRSFTYATAVTNKQPTTNGHNNHQQHQLPQPQSQQQRPASQPSTVQQQQAKQQNNSAQQLNNNSKQKQNLNQPQSQQEPIGDIPINSKHNKNNPVDSEWKEVKSRRRRSGKA